MHATVTELASESSASTDQEQDVAPAEDFTPAVSVRKSLAPRDHIISMIDGKPHRTLRRHLATKGVTPDQYSQRYNLQPDYPMVAPAYSEARRDMAKKIGLGAKGRGARGAAAAEGKAAPKRGRGRGRPPKQR